MSIGSTVATWGSTPGERAADYPCDELLGPHDRILYRALDVAAPAALVFRWLCQIRVAPYSYDLLDNLGRRSPRQLTPGLDQLEPGQRFAIFRLVSFEPDRSITLVSDTLAFGHVVLTYSAIPATKTTTRLVAKLGVRPRTGVWRLAGSLLAAGDLVMMRKQLRTLRDLAERDASMRAG